jgi:DHA2 family multidrug resistance protein
LGYTASLSGMMVFWRAIVIALFTPITARLAASTRIDTRIMIFGGFATIALSQLWLASITTPQSDFITLLLPAVLGGVGIAFVFVPMSIVVLSSVPPQVVPKATAFQSLSFQIGGSFSVAALVTLIARRSAFHQEALAQFASASHPPFAQLLHEHGSLAQYYAQVMHQAGVLAFADAQYALGTFTLVLLPLVLILPRRRRNSAPSAVPLE